MLESATNVGGVSFMKSSDLCAAAPGFSVTANGTIADPSSNSLGP